MRFLSLLSPSDVSVVVGWCCDLLCSVMLMMLCTAKREREREKISEDPDSFLSEPGNLTLRIIPTSQRVVRPFSFDVNRSLSQKRPSRSAVLVHRLLIIIDCVVLVCHSKERNEAASTMTDEKLYITNAEKVRGLFVCSGWMALGSWLASGPTRSRRAVEGSRMTCV